MTRIDTRPHVQHELKGVRYFGAKVIHAIQMENVTRRQAYCGAAVENCKGSAKAINCSGCLADLRRLGYAG